jgi:very-short-patch-repair endonuclease
MPVIPNSSQMIARARALRKGGNIAEAALWNVLKARKLGGHKFVRQHPIGPYIADFAHRQQRLVIEVDGSQHIDSNHDVKRDAFMASCGFSILRFWSKDVLRNREAVCETILSALEGNLEPVRTMDLVYIRASCPSPSSAPPTPPLPQAGED